MLPFYVILLTAVNNINVFLQSDRKFLSDSNHIWIFHQNLIDISSVISHENFSPGIRADRCGRPGGQSNIPKQMGVFRKFGKETQKLQKFGPSLSPRFLSVFAWPLYPFHILNFFTASTKLDTDNIPAQNSKSPVFYFPNAAITMLWSCDSVRQEGRSDGYLFHRDTIYDSHAAKYRRRSFSLASPLEPYMCYYSVCDIPLTNAIQTRPLQLQTRQYLSITFHNITGPPNITQPLTEMSTRSISWG